jgi:hypothetical protein
MEPRCVVCSFQGVSTSKLMEGGVFKPPSCSAHWHHKEKVE